MLSQKNTEMLKNQLLERKQELLEQTASSKTIITNLLNEETYDDMDYAEVSTDSYNLNIVRDKQLQELEEVEVALRKIENNTYGICEMCDEPIGVKRLKIKPHAKFCVECRPVYEKSMKEKEKR